MLLKGLTVIFICFPLVNSAKQNKDRFYKGYEGGRPMTSSPYKEVTSQPQRHYDEATKYLNQDRSSTSNILSSRFTSLQQLNRLKDNQISPHTNNPIPRMRRLRPTPHKLNQSFLEHKYPHKYIPPRYEQRQSSHEFKPIPPLIPTNQHRPLYHEYKLAPHEQTPPPQEFQPLPSLPPPFEYRPSAPLKYRLRSHHEISFPPLIPLHEHMPPYESRSTPHERKPPPREIKPLFHEHKPILHEHKHKPPNKSKLPKYIRRPASHKSKHKLLPETLPSTYRSSKYGSISLPHESERWWSDEHISSAHNKSGPLSNYFHQSRLSTRDYEPLTLPHEQKSKRHEFRHDILTDQEIKLEAPPELSPLNYQYNSSTDPDNTHSHSKPNKYTGNIEILRAISEMFNPDAIKRDINISITTNSNKKDVPLMLDPEFINMETTISHFIGFNQFIAVTPLE